MRLIFGPSRGIHLRVSWSAGTLGKGYGSVDDELKQSRMLSISLSSLVVVRCLAAQLWRA